jgi:hypothetical protein
MYNEPEVTASDLSSDPQKTEPKNEIFLIQIALIAEVEAEQFESYHLE